MALNAHRDRIRLRDRSLLHALCHSRFVPVRVLRLGLVHMLCPFRLRASNGDCKCEQRHSESL